MIFPLVHTACSLTWQAQVREAQKRKWLSGRLRRHAGRYVPRSPRWLIVTTTQFAASVACNSLEGIILLRERIAMRQFTCRINNALHVQHWAASCTGRQATVLMYNSHFEQSVSVTECYLLLIEQVRWDRAAAVAVTHSSNTVEYVQKSMIFISNTELV